MTALSPSEFAALLALGTAMSFTPGPNTTLSAALAANLGLRRAVRFCLAVPVGWTLILLLCSAGLGAVVQAVGWLRLAIKWLGLAYLLWLAWQLAGARRLSDADPARLRVGFLQGVALQFLNIKAWMLALAVSTGWVLPDPSLPRLMTVAATMAGFAFFSNLSYALVGTLLRDWLAVGARLVWFNRLMAGVMLATAGWMGVST